MPGIRTPLAIAACVLRKPRILKAKLSLNLFLLGYLRKFRVKKVGENLIVHSHLPPLNSRAYGRFIDEHLLGRTAGPSHAQIGLTNACPQHCAYCYNRGRSGGRPMDTPTILRVVRELKAMGVFWLGWTGGEPLLNKDIVEITEKASEDCAIKLFTTGCTLTKETAQNLKKAGLFSVSVSLDHWQESIHDRSRGYPGAFQTALQAVRIFREVAGLHVGVSAVLSKEIIAQGKVEEFLEFLRGLGLDEVWLSETKPSVGAYRDKSQVITEAERQSLVRLQDRWNSRRGMTVNYLGHFEGGEHFGCNAGHKMVYVDAFGEVSPCVFAPLSFGRVQERPLADIIGEMKARFPSESECFVNKNCEILKRFSFEGEAVISGSRACKMMSEIRFGPRSRFMEIYDR